MSNIRDIASLANVSVTTVSRVLNNHPYVSQEKREAVWQAMKQMNYQKNINAVHLSKGKTNVIGVVIPHIYHPYFSLLLEGIAQEAQLNEYKLMIIQTNYEAKKEMEALDMLKHKQVDGVVITSRESSLEVIMEYVGYGPVVLCEEIDEKEISSVCIDHYHAFKDAMNFLIEKGHRHIGYCINRTEGKSSLKRREAYMNVLQGIGEPLREEWIFKDCLFIEDGERVVEEWVNLQHRPTALLVTNDSVAAGIIIECKKRGIRVPSDLAIIGFDNEPIAKALNITTMELPLRKIGQKAFQQCLREEAISHIVLPYKLVERETM
ncbi:MAG TPA: LacI family DNA-binding transcriptional regulator [Bacillus sp. (in: firmicutes)]|nr:LacI family DNA-binding transcriptional regulator [Bacillus sp. (in: firmicutes)]